MSGENLRWDLSSRLLHWGVAFSVISVYFLDGGDPPHNNIGYLAAVLVILRLLYGLNKKFPRENQIARVVYLLMWLGIFALALTGWMYEWDRFWGEEWLHNLHVNISYGLLALIALHLAGILKDAWIHRRPTWMAMITGKR